MSDLSNKLKSILNDLESKLETENDKNNVRVAFSILLDEIDKDIEKRMKILEKSQREVEFKMNKVDETLNKIKNEFYLDEEYDEEDYTFEIACPYCNYTFETELDELKTEVKCPECNNIIELDWNSEDDGCSGGCSHCHGCEPEEYEDEDDDM